LLYKSVRGHLTVEKEIERTGNTHRGFKKSTELTRIILQKIKQRAPGVKIFAFSVDYSQPYYDEFKDLAMAEGITFIDGIPQAVKARADGGYETQAADRGHWNELGHKVVGEKLAAYFINHGLNQDHQADKAAKP
jgi:hypothetical protein